MFKKNKLYWICMTVLLYFLKSNSCYDAIQNSSPIESNNSVNKNGTIVNLSANNKHQIQKRQFFFGNSIESFHNHQNHYPDEMPTIRFHVCSEKESCVPILLCTYRTPGKIRMCGSVPVPQLCCLIGRKRKELGRQNYFNVDYDKSKCQIPITPLPLVLGTPVAARTLVPWMVAVGEKKTFDKVDWFCGGALISRNVVLTAAHCVNQRTANLVRLGDLDLSRYDEQSYPIDIYVERVVSHPDYQSNSLYNDIAVIILEKDVPFNDFVSPICLPPVTYGSATDDHDGEEVIVTGWGEDSITGTRSPVLKKAQVRILNNDYCNYIFESANVNKKNFPQGIISTQLCAGDADSERGTCKGDSGGPLVLRKKNSYTIIGIVSSGLCGVQYFPEVYTRVASFVPWIMQFLDR